MKAFLTCFSAFLLLILDLPAQCPPDGGITFSNQSQIDSFYIKYPDCTELVGGVTIVGYDITNLQGLRSLTTIKGRLAIGGFYRGNPELISLEGLNRLKQISGSLNIESNKKIVNLKGLDSLTTVGGSLVISGYINGNFSLTSLDGLDNLTNIGGSLTIEVNRALTNIKALSNLDSIGLHLDIIANSLLSSLEGLEKVKKLGSVNLHGNNLLTSLRGLDGLKEIKYLLRIMNNIAMLNLEGLENLKTIGGDMEIYANPSLVSLTGLDSLETISGNLIIGKEAGHLGNTSIASLEGLESLTTIGGNARIANNPNLTSLLGLRNLSAIGDYFVIGDHPKLQDLSGLENLRTVNGVFGIFASSEESANGLRSLKGIENMDPAALTHLILESSPQLSFCALENICTYLLNGGSNSIYGNGTGCNTFPEIEAACKAVSVEEKGLSKAVIFPNPTEGLLNLEIENATFREVKLSNFFGRQVYKTLLSGSQINIGHLPSGIYFLEATTASGFVFKRKIVKI